MHVFSPEGISWNAGDFCLDPGVGRAAAQQRGGGVVLMSDLIACLLLPNGKTPRVLQSTAVPAVFCITVQ